jgi:hypothetical protein
MPNHVLINIINSMPLDSRQLLETCKPATPLIRAGAMDIVAAIHKAKLMPESPALSSVPSTPGLTAPMAVFSLVSPSPQHPLPVSSPVLNEAELYQAAGWIGSVHPGHSHSQDYSGPRAPSGVPLLDVSAFSTPTRLLTPHGKSAAKATPAVNMDWESGTTGMLRFSDDDVDSDGDESDSDKEAQAKARSIMQAMSGDHLGLQAAQSSMLEPPATPSTGQKRAREETGEAAGDPPTKRSTLRTPETGEHLSMMSPVPPSLASVKSPEPDSAIPKTMRDIYKLSNENRRKNKDKKKGGDKAEEQGSGKAGSSMFDEDKDDGESKESGGDANAFMKDIGWTTGAAEETAGAAVEDKAKGGGEKAQPVRRGGSGAGKQAAGQRVPATFAAYDYSKGAAAAPVPVKGKRAAPVADTFNPYSDANQPVDKRIAKPKLGGRGQQRSFSYANKKEGGGGGGGGRGGRGGGRGGRGGGRGGR